MRLVPKPTENRPEHLLCPDCGHNEQTGTEGDRCAECGSVSTVGTGWVDSVGAEDENDDAR